MIVLIMGVAGAGKTTVGTLLAGQLGWEFADADNFHSAENVEKIRRGLGLTDEDRVPWLRDLRAAMVGWIADARNVVLACSALKESYRQQLMVGPGVRLVYLQGTREVIAERLRARHGHFAGEQLLASQLAILEEPRDAVVVSVDGHSEEIATALREMLALE